MAQAESKQEVPREEPEKQVQARMAAKNLRKYHRDQN